MSKTQNKKSKFRSSSVWKNFRKYMKSKCKVDAITGKPLYAGWNLHHLDLDAEHYEILNEDNFACLNAITHDCIHWIYRYQNWREILENIAALLTEMDRINGRSSEPFSE